MARILIAGTGSGCGKTTVTLSLLSALKKRGISVCSFKCGPDYIDPMFHKRVLGLPAFNLDPFFLDGNGLRRLLSEGAKDSSLSVIEGVMGYYDGVANTTEGSSFTVSQCTDTPVILVVSCKGVANSVGAIMSGFKNYVPDSGIRGVIFNHLSAALSPDMADVARRAGLLPLGHLPASPEYRLGSRHLGLVTAGELKDLNTLIDKLGAKAEETLDIVGIIKLASGAKALEAESPERHPISAGARIAVSRDEAFCFMYDESILLLEKLGCEIVYFSPLRDEALPPDIGGLWLCGGYPELYARRLAQNKSMLRSIKAAIDSGLPTIAECGGFMYLHERLADSVGTGHEMVGVIKGVAFPTEQLIRFGYLTLTAKKDNLLCEQGGSFRVHEFHYWDSTACGEDFRAKKAAKDIEWDCAHASGSLYAGFPHLYLYAAPETGVNFVNKARNFQNNKSI